MRRCSPTGPSMRSSLQRRTHHGEWAEWHTLNFGISDVPHSFTSPPSLLSLYLPCPILPVLPAVHRTMS